MSLDMPFWIRQVLIWFWWMDFDDWNLKNGLWWLDGNSNLFSPHSTVTFKHNCLILDHLRKNQFVSSFKKITSTCVDFAFVSQTHALSDARGCTNYWVTHNTTQFKLPGKRNTTRSKNCENTFGFCWKTCFALLDICIHKHFWHLYS